MKKLQKGNVIIWIILIVIILALAVWYYMKNGYQLPQATPQPPTVMNTNDFDTAAKELDSTNLNQIDAGINQIGSDAASF